MKREFSLSTEIFIILVPDMSSIKTFLSDALFEEKGWVIINIENKLIKNAVLIYILVIKIYTV